MFLRPRPVRAAMSERGTGCCVPRILEEVVVLLCVEYFTRCAARGVCPGELVAWSPGRRAVGNGLSLGRPIAGSPLPVVPAPCIPTPDKAFFMFGFLRSEYQ